ncbi:hypothetical protein HYZ78_00530 [Candidatus Microgenomates bacterium]|nr:hypothetical protein [Candidatus Microgenomates bacterium]
MQDKYIKKQVQRINQKIKILVVRPDFQDDISKLRDKWQIPAEGIKTDEHRERWYGNLLVSTDKYYDEVWPLHRKELDQLRKKKKIKELEEKRKQLNLMAPLNAFKEDISVMVQKYKIPPKWHHSIERYLLFNDPENMNVSLGVTIRTEKDEKTKLEKLYLEIEADTTLEDIKHIWPSVNFFQSKLSYRKRKKFQPIRKLDLYKFVYDLREEGKTYKHIASRLENKFPRKSGPYEYEEVGDFIKKFKKLTGIN